ncbi:MAG: prepilin-type N-terminal cleavage/methylation domain-containing protein [Candidatus Eremiobacteraeota bacterium]|nr:prepilin-type N-terminal cleavage/methylation domain-containing protein [Candidatus Eremiobacteraeota bacterium]
MENKNKGFTIIEVIIAIFIISCGLMALFSTFSLSIRHATQSRNKVCVDVIADSMLEGVRAHRYGEPKPPSWEKPRMVLTVIQGKISQTTFHIKVKCKNQSFIDEKINKDYDYVTIEITWSEGTGVGSRGIKRMHSETVPVRRGLD